jgi:hypothetical protein
MSDAFINSPLVPKQCSRCTGWIYECHINGWETKVEPNPLNFQEELAMRLEGRRIFQTVEITNSTLMPRTAWHIERSDSRAKVFATHSCKTPTYFEPSPLDEKPTQSKSEGIPF